MATTFVIACPDCGKQVKVSDEHVGKKVKCKECGTVYPVKAPGGAPAPPPAGKAKATQAKAPAGKSTQAKPPPPPTKAEVPEEPAEPSTGYKYVDDDDDENAPKHYTVTADDSTLPRCPFCANEMATHDALICLNCGYNTRTRMRPEVVQVYAPTGGEWFLHLLPGILCVLTMIGLLVWYIIFWMNIEGWMKDSAFEDEPGPPTTYIIGLGPGFCRLYLALITAALYVPLVRFSWKRLVKNYRPRERKIKED